MASITARGNKFRADVRKVGFQPQRKSFSTREEAVTWAAELEARMASGKEIERPLADITDITGLVELYARVTDEQDAPTSDLNEIRASPIANLMASELTKEDVLAWLPNRCPLSDLLENVIEKARRDFGIRLPSNPVTSAYSTETIRKRRLPPYEEKQLLESADKSRAGYLRDAITLALETSLTQTELVNLDFSQIVDNRILVSNRSGDRLIPLTDKALSVINHRLGVNANNDTQVFSGLTEVALQRSFIRARDRANIEDLHFNDLRHEAIFRMKERYSLEQIWRISGVGIRSLARYYGDPEAE
jgi:integrase